MVDPRSAIYKLRVNANAADAMCLCGLTLRYFEKNKCNKISNKSLSDHVKYCAQLYRRLDGKKPQCVCPVDPTVNDGTCGVPMHLDLYGLGKKNGIIIDASVKEEVLLLDLHQGNETSGNKTIPMENKCTESVEIFGLEKFTHLKGYKMVSKWVNHTATVNAELFQSSYIRWEDTIPKKVGEFILEHCADLKWGVKKTFVCNDSGDKNVIGKIKFHGLTYDEISGNRRRRLLGRGQQGC